VRGVQSELQRSGGEGWRQTLSRQLFRLQRYLLVTAMSSHSIDYVVAGHGTVYCIVSSSNQWHCSFIMRPS